MVLFGQLMVIAAAKRCHPNQLHSICIQDRIIQQDKDRLSSLSSWLKFSTICSPFPFHDTLVDVILSIVYKVAGNLTQPLHSPTVFPVCRLQSSNICVGF
ncbi:unnamed protein product [Trichobilharzia szidati]|nr:unnamed protein product [Trichobilharzia szidati]